jgi:hypothetical protein
MARLTFEQAWHEAVGALPDAGTKLDALFNSGTARAYWESGEPLGMLVRAALPPAPPWTNYFGAPDAAAH